MYELILDNAERRAIDWVGHRYDHGDKLKDLLTVCNMFRNVGGNLDTEVEWSDPDEIVFHIPEHKAWSIHEIIDGSSLDCLSDDLVKKLLDFAASVV